jgi:hypothetical protein
VPPWSIAASGSSELTTIPQSRSTSELPETVKAPLAEGCSAQTQASEITALATARVVIEGAVPRNMPAK